MSDATIIVVGRVTTIITQVPRPTLIRGVSEPVVIANPQVGPQGIQGEPGLASVTSISAPGGYVITNIRLNAAKEIVITYLDEPVE